MKPLNRRTRTKAILKVVGFFLLAFFVAVLLSFMTISTPQYSNKRCQEQLSGLQESLEFQREIIAPQVSETKGLIQKIPNHSILEENLEVLNSDIGAAISNLRSEIQGLQIPDTTLYKDVIVLMSSLQMAYNRQLDLGETASNFNEIASQLQLYKTENQRLEDQVESLQAGASRGTDCSQYEKQIKDLEKKVESRDETIRALEVHIENLRKQ